ncbi:Uncharacterized protein PECH_001918 [Penicillium ucsense]|uniref:Clr5 domain-containing protein n=1 Tax=Penicillium ucsense TaxID=2839758 RepID=A0A8J8WHF8_9EURO|nr:Uncharacterized protein PECM_008406 [Penicillium ucsense]KAF7731481.1 Uncharacterized protein PECH_001918 [Penicillium ucsense]
MEPYPPPSSATLSPQSPPVGPVGQAPSSIFRPRRSDDWHKYRDIIEQLYRNDQLKLRDVKRIMEREYRFYASEKQYKDRLAAWHVRKNIKAKEVHLMIRKQQKRAARGKATAFRVNGQDVDDKRIARFVRRYGRSWNNDKDRNAEEQSPEPKTPSDMTCYTPEPEDMAPTPVSPPDVQSPTRETSAYPLSYDPNSIENIPDLIMDDDHHTFPPMHMHPSQAQTQAQARRPFHPSEPTIHQLSLPPYPTHQPHQSRPSHPSHPSHPSYSSHPPPPAGHSQSGHPSLQAAPSHSVVHALPSQPAMTHGQSHEPHAHSHQAQPPSMLPQPGSAPHHATNMNGTSSMYHQPRTGTYANLDAFQNRLGELGTTLNESMAKWARDQDPNQELYHEGLGL